MKREGEKEGRKVGRKGGVEEKVYDKALYNTVLLLHTIRQTVT